MIRWYENKDKIINSTEKIGKRQNADSRVCPNLIIWWEGEIKEGKETELCSETGEENHVTATNSSRRAIIETWVLNTAKEIRHQWP